MDFEENGSSIHFTFKGEKRQEIIRYNKDTEEVFLQTQISGRVQEYDFVEIGLYTNPSLPLCVKGAYVSVQIPVDKFIRSEGWVNIGIKAEGRTSSFAHMSHWELGNTDANVYLNFDNLYDVWTKTEFDLPQVELYMMLTGIRGGRAELIMRDKQVLTFEKDPNAIRPIINEEKESPETVVDRKETADHFMENETLVPTTFDDVINQMFTSQSVIKLTNFPGMLIYYRFVMPSTIVKFSAFEGEDLYSAETLTKEVFKNKYEEGEFSLSKNAAYMSVDSLPDHLKYKES